jgi:glutaredoxin
MVEASIRSYGANRCPDYRHSKAFLRPKRMSYQHFDIDQDSNALEYVEQQNYNKLIIPTIMFANGSIGGGPETRN